MAVKKFSPTGDICKFQTTHKHREGRRKTISFSEVPVRVSHRLSNCNIFIDCSVHGKNTCYVFAKYHFVRKVSKLLIYVERLTKKIDFTAEVTLKFKPVSNLRFEFLKVSTVPDHSDFIYQNYTIFRKTIMANNPIIYQIAPRNRHSRIDIPAFLFMLESIFDKEGSFTTPFFTKHHCKGIRIDILLCKKMKGTKSQNGKETEPKHYIILRSKAKKPYRKTTATIIKTKGLCQSKKEKHKSKKRSSIQTKRNTSVYPFGAPAKARGPKRDYLRRIREKIPTQPPRNKKPVVKSINGEPTMVVATACT